MSMTIDEIRHEKEVAEASIRGILETLRSRTGMAPETVEFTLVDTTSLGQRLSRVVGYVTITMESI